jgi:hypothetical protein
MNLFKKEKSSWFMFNEHYCVNLSNVCRINLKHDTIKYYLDSSSWEDRFDSEEIAKKVFKQLSEFVCDID